MPQDAIVVAGEAGILGTIPILLGFHPDDSIVVVALTRCGRRYRLGPVMRVDYPSGAHVSDLLENMASLAASLTEAVAIVLYHPDAQSLSDEEILPLFADLSVVTILRVTDPGPQILDARTEAAAVLSGRRVLQSRAELVTSIAHRSVDFIDADELLRPFTDSFTRDGYLIAHLTDPATLPELITAAQAAPDDDRRTAHLCAALAAVAYHHCDGALAQAACARALTIDPDHRFARLLIECMSLGMPPQELSAGLLGL